MAGAFDLIEMVYPLPWSRIEPIQVILEWMAVYLSPCSVGGPLPWYSSWKHHKAKVCLAHVTADLLRLGCKTELVYWPESKIGSRGGPMLSEHPTRQRHKRVIFDVHHEPHIEGTSTPPDPLSPFHIEDQWSRPYMSAQEYLCMLVHACLGATCQSYKTCITHCHGLLLNIPENLQQ